MSVMKVMERMKLVMSEGDQSIAEEINSLERDFKVTFDREAGLLLRKLFPDPRQTNVTVQVVDQDDLGLRDRVGREKLYQEAYRQGLSPCHPLTIFPLAREKVGEMAVSTRLYLGMAPIQYGGNHIVFFLEHSAESGYWIDMADPHTVEENWIFRV